MATTQNYADREYTNVELREMDDDEARETLTVQQYERREKLLDLHDQAEATRSEWAEQDQQVAEITVSADMDELGTAVDVFGNDLLVRVDPEDDAVRDAVDAIGDLEADVGDLRDVGVAAGAGGAGGTDGSDGDADATDATAAADIEVPDLSAMDEDLDRVAGTLMNLLDAIIVRWDGVAWADLDERQRHAILADARSEWGIDGLIKGYVDIMVAVHEDREGRMEAIESFRGAERRGRR